MFESNAIVGRVGNIRQAEINGKKVINVSLALQRGKDQTTWWDLAFWGEQAEIFSKPDITKGTILAANVHGIYADAYLDKENKPKGVVKATVNFFRVVYSPGQKEDSQG